MRIRAVFCLMIVAVALYACQQRSAGFVETKHPTADGGAPTSTPAPCKTDCADEVKAWKQSSENAMHGLEDTLLKVQMLNKQIADLQAQLRQARAQAADVNVANMAACPLWNAPDSSKTATVLYEASSASVNVNLTLIPLPGAPRISLGPHSALAPRWLIPGRIQPEMIGGTRQGVFYYYNADAQQWQGPYAPARVQR